MGALLCGALLVPACSAARTLPDHRVYELVTSYQEDGREAGLNGVETGFGIASTDGDAVDWEGLGACCGATSGAENLYQSDRGPNGWQTRALTPTPSETLIGLFEEQAPEFVTSDLEQTIWATPASYAAGADRPKYSDDDDLYLQEPSGAMKWISQGPAGTGSGRFSAEFDQATPHARQIAFSSAEQLTANATGMAPLNSNGQYLYVRDVEHETTSLIDVNDNGELLNPYGAALGNGRALSENLLSSGREGTTTNAISDDGKKVFFETPAANSYEIPVGQVPHLYMRDLANETTVPLDDPSSEQTAEYEGASTDGSLVFFTSDEGLDGAPPVKELYEFNTTASPIGPVGPMSAIPITTGAEGVSGVSAIANDGSHVYFVAHEVLTPEANPIGAHAEADQPNLYVYDTGTGQTSFVATLDWADVSPCGSTCGEGGVGGLIAEPDLARPSYPTPDGSVLVFTATANVTGQSTAPTTRLTAAVFREEHVLHVESTAGFSSGRTIEVDSGPSAELATVETIDSPTEMTLAEYEPSSFKGLWTEHGAGARVSEPDAEVYRYAPAEHSLLCVSCDPPGVLASGSADAGLSAGGSYAPTGEDVPMTEDGSEVFFDSSDPLVPEAQVAASDAPKPPTNVYEWENGSVSLISDGSTNNSILNGTTPSGGDVFFASREELVPGGSSGTSESIYDARVDGGFPTTLPPAPCAGSDCRSQTGTTAFFSIPASSTLGTASQPATQVIGAPTYAVAAITSAQRRQLARSGSLTLAVTATAAGRLAAKITAKLHGRAQRVAHAEATLTGGGTAKLTFHLSAAARARLAAGKTLTLHLEVSYSESTLVKLASLTVHASVAARRRDHHA